MKWSTYIIWLVLIFCGAGFLTTVAFEFMNVKDTFIAFMGLIGLVLNLLFFVKLTIYVTNKFFDENSKT